MLSNRPNPVTTTDQTSLLASKLDTMKSRFLQRRIFEEMVNKQISVVFCFIWICYDMTVSCVNVFIRRCICRTMRKQGARPGFFRLGMLNLR